MSYLSTMNTLEDGVGAGVGMVDKRTKAELRTTATSTLIPQNCTRSGMKNREPRRLPLSCGKKSRERRGGRRVVVENL